MTDTRVNSGTAILCSRFARDQAPAAEAEMSNELNAGRALCARERISIIEQAIYAMEPRQRIVFVLNRIHELSYADISRRLRMPETTVKRLIAAAIIDCERNLRAQGLSGEGF